MFENVNHIRNFFSEQPEISLQKNYRSLRNEGVKGLRKNQIFKSIK